MLTTRREISPNTTGELWRTPSLLGRVAPGGRCRSGASVARLDPYRSQPRLLAAACWRGRAGGARISAPATGPRSARGPPRTWPFRSSPGRPRGCTAPPPRPRAADRGVRTLGCGPAAEHRPVRLLLAALNGEQHRVFSRLPDDAGGGAPDPPQLGAVRADRPRRRGLLCRHLTVPARQGAPCGALPPRRHPPRSF